MLQLQPPDIVLFELRQDRGDLPGRHPTERSAKPPEEDDDAGLILPELLEGGLVLADSVAHLHLGDGGRIHDNKLWSEILVMTAVSRLPSNTLPHADCNMPCIPASQYSAQCSVDCL